MRLILHKYVLLASINKISILSQMHDFANCRSRFFNFESVCSLSQLGNILENLYYAVRCFKNL